MLKDAQARVVRKKTWQNYYLLGLESQQIARQAEPGQFLMVRVNDQPYPLLRRPFSIHAREGDSVDVFFVKAGVGTAILAKKETGESLDILGPLGKGFVIEEQMQGKAAYLVGGGRGIAPFYFLAQELRARSIQPKVIYGGRTLADLPLLPKFAAAGFEVLCSTDDGSYGSKCLASELLKDELGRSRPAQIYACGPEPMMKTIAALAAAHDIPAQFSLESVMGCGIGACWGCVKRIKRGDKAEWVKICEDGPVFRGTEIVWEGTDS
jgi:dihydroorotate dehydrogenase electron transfer subunit